MNDPTQDYQAIWATLALPDAGVAETVGLEQTILVGGAMDWRDTLRSSLPHLPLGEETSAHFRMERVLGRGGMGVVHLAHQTALGRHVAIKTVPADLVSREAENALLQEARVMGAVEHPNVVPVHVIGQDDAGRPVIVMKRIEGTTWDEFIEGHAPIEADDPLGFHLGICTAVCRAISFAHSRGILHRDIKPANVMVGRFGEVYVLDWGLAVSMDSAERHIPLARTANDVVGTPVYMAPEMTVGQGEQLGPHTDVFLIGAVLYHVITGVPPNRGTTLFDVMSFSYLGKERPYPDDAPAELVRICERAMHLDPGQRYSSADDLREALEGFSAHRNSIDLATAASARLTELTAALAETPPDDDLVYRLFGEARFGFASAIQIWPENPEARAGLQRCLTLLIEHEIAESNVKAARVLLLELPEPSPELATRVDELATRLSERDQELQQLEYDYDENVGLGVKRTVVAIMGAAFALSPLLPLAFSATGLEAGEMGLIFSLAFAPLMIGNVIYTQKRYANHRVSRVFAKSVAVMWGLGLVSRSSWYWGGVPFNLAVAGELAVFSSGLLTLALGIDRRLAAAAVPFGLTAIPIVLYPDWTFELFGAAGVLACVAFIAFDYFRDIVR